MDSQILEELYERYYTRVLLYALTLCGDEELAKDLTADAFVKAYLTLPNDPPSFLYWLMRVCKNLWLDHLRRQRRLIPLENTPQISATDPLETTYLSSQRNIALWSAIRTLSPMDQEIVTLYYFSKLPLPQVATMVGRSYAATRQRLCRLRQTLKQEMEEQGYDF